MTLTDRRLDRLYSALSAKERGLLVLQAHKAGEQPDRTIYDTCPFAQAAAFNRYIHLMNAVNFELASVLYIIHEQVEKTDLKHAWLMTLLLWGWETQRLGGHVLAATKDRKLRRDVPRLMARAPGDLRVPVELTLPPEEPDVFKKGYGDEMVRAVLFGIKQGLQQHWCELRAIEIGVQEVAEEFGGEDPLRADTREMIDDCLRSCTALRDDLKPYVEIDLPEPGDDDVALLRKFIEKAADG
jgi:hypothetical protein